MKNDNSTKQSNASKPLLAPVFEWMFNRWTRWELYKENQLYIQVTCCSPLLGNYETNRDSVLVDIYCKENKFTGMKKYKRVVKYR
jgi:hypothetical protein